MPSTVRSKKAPPKRRPSLDEQERRNKRRALKRAHHEWREIARLARTLDKTIIEAQDNMLGTLRFLAGVLDYRIERRVPEPDPSPTAFSDDQIGE